MRAIGGTGNKCMLLESGRGGLSSEDGGVKMEKLGNDDNDNIHGKVKNGKGDQL